MFDSSFPFSFIKNEKPAEGDLHLKTSLYKCKGEKSKQQYIIRVEQYKCDVYAIKFHLKNHTTSDEKYKITTGLEEVQQLLGTCIAILLQIHQESPFASFIVVGMNGREEQTLENTKRYRVYKKVLENKFSPIEFDHFDLTQYSCYFMLNKSHPDGENALKYVEEKILDVLGF